MLPFAEVFKIFLIFPISFLALSVDLCYYDLLVDLISIVGVSMVDIHCHILPQVDDGADSMDTSLLMARMAADSGVHTIIGTPHCNLPYAENKNYRDAPLAMHFVELIQRIREANIPVEILPGAEVMCMPDTVELLRKRQLVTLARSDYLLVEFFFDEDLDYMEDMLSAIAAEGIRPVVAHPERYGAVQRMPGVVERWFNSGYVIQLNKGSILGRLGRGAEKTAARLLSRGLAHIIASDAHDTLVRTANMNSLRNFVEENYGSDYAEVLLELNPSRICSNLPMLQAD